jgi:hypothetical protein
MNNEKFDFPSYFSQFYFYVAQHYLILGDAEKALNFINLSIDITPTIVELYLVKSKILKHCLYLNEVSKQNESIYVKDWMGSHYEFYYDEMKDEEYINPCVSIYLSLYSDYLGNDSDPNDDVPAHSITFLLNLRKYDNKNELTFKFYKYENDKLKYNNVIYVYNGDAQIGEIYYYETLNVSHDWIITFLNENLKIN